MYGNSNNNKFMNIKLRMDNSVVIVKDNPIIQMILIFVWDCTFREDS